MLIKDLGSLEAIAKIKMYCSEKISDRQYTMFYAQNNLRKYFELVEEKSLMDFMNSMLNSNIKNNFIKDQLSFIVSYLCSFIPMKETEESEVYYSDSQWNLENEAEFVVKEFIEAFCTGTISYYTSIKDLIPSMETKLQTKTISRRLKVIKKIDGIDANNPSEFLRWINMQDSSDWLTKRLSKVFYSEVDFNNFMNIIEVICEVIRQANQDIKDFGGKYNIILGSEAELRCLFNCFNLYLHKTLVSGRVITTQDMSELIYAASVIHPLQDDYIDNEDVTESIFEIMDKKLRGEECTFPNEKVGDIFKMIDIIYNHYPRQCNPQLVDIFVQLNYWQFQSLSQKKSCDTESLLKISFMKGGYAFAFFGYMIIGPMSPACFRHFFAMGAIFQLMDDLHDIELDMEKNVCTICTQEYLTNHSVDRAVKGIVKVQQRYEEVVPLISDVRYPVLLRRMEQIAVRFDIIKFSCMNNSYFSQDYMYQIAKCIPVEIELAVGFFKRKSTLKTSTEYLDLIEELNALLEKLHW